MKTLIIYSSATGFTAKYARWLAERIQADVLPVHEAEKKSDVYFKPYDALVYGGWALAGSIHKSNWFLDHLEQWKDKRLAIFCVGASPLEDNEEVNEFLENALSPEQKRYAKVFYCPGGLNYERMGLGYRLMMRAFAAVMKRKHPEDKKMHELISSSYDISDPKYLDALIAYLGEGIKNEK